VTCVTCRVHACRANDLFSVKRNKRFLSTLFCVHYMYNNQTAMISLTTNTAATLALLHVLSVLALEGLVVVSAAAGSEESSALRRRLLTPSSAPTTFDEYLGDCEPPLWVDDRKYWTDLTVEQKCAARRVGYTVDAWNNDEDPNKNACSATCGEPYPTTVSTTSGSDYMLLGWDDLTAVGGCGNLQTQFQILGYNKDSWDDFYQCYTWADIIEAEMRLNAKALGYNRFIWNNCLDDVCIVGVEDKDWADLSLKEQAAASAFGCE